MNDRVAGRASLRVAVGALLLIAVAAVAAYTVLTCRMPISLHGPGPELDGIVSRTTLAHESPSDTLVVYVLAMLALTVAFALLDLPLARLASRLVTHSEGPAPARDPVLWTVTIAAFVVFAASRVPSFGRPLIDAFHEGEYLAFAQAFATGQGFERSFFIHGPGMQALPGILAAAIDPGRMVAMARLVRFAMLALAWGGLGLATYDILRVNGIQRPGRGAFLVLTLMLGLDHLLILITERYLVAFWQAALLIRVLDPRAGRRSVGLHSFVVGSTLPVGFLHNYANGLSLAALALIAWGLLLARDRAKALLGAVGATVGGIVSLALIAGFSPSGLTSVSEQIGYWARYGGRIFHEHPSFRGDWALFWMVVTAQALFCSVLVVRFLKVGLRRLGQESVLSTMMLAWTLVVGVSQLTRAESSHLRWLAALCALAGLTLASEADSEPRTTLTTTGKHVCVAALLGLLAVTAVWLPEHPWRVFKYVRSVAVVDSEVVSPETQASLASLRSEVETTDCFYTLTSEGIWYALTGKPSCSRFHQLAYAATAVAQYEVVRDLKQSQPGVILVASANDLQATDHIPVSVTHPIVWSYVQKAYEPFRTFGKLEFWRRRPELFSRPPEGEQR